MVRAQPTGTMARCRPVALPTAVVSGVLAACGGQVPDVVLESVDYEIVDCPPATPDGSDCLAVTAPVVGEGSGSGSCAMYAAGTEGNLAKVAESGELALTAGQTVTWEIVVQRPDDPDFRSWNPVCTPMAEG